MTFQISPSPRVRRSPYFEETVADGAVTFSTYNHMLLPMSYGDPMAEYWRLINGVAMWDVAVQRQVAIEGPDAARLAQILTPRRLDRLKPGIGWYVPICDHRGVLINDPVLLMHAPDRFWFSIADADLESWARAIAAERGLDVNVHEPDVSPLAVQGPKAEDVVASLLGPEVRDIRHFRFREMSLEGIPLVVARSGWSKQGGFELYLTDGTRGGELWQAVREAGQPFDIGPGAPNGMERVESGLLSFGGDTDSETNPFEVRMERYIDLNAPDDTIGIQALRDIRSAGPKRHQLGVFIDCEQQLAVTDRNSLVRIGDREIGRITARAWSPRLSRNIGLGLMAIDALPGQSVTVLLPEGDEVAGELTELPFL